MADNNLNIDIVKFRLVGVSPLLMHAPNTVDPLNEYSVMLSERTSKRKKTQDDQLEIAKIQWMAAMYHDENLGPYVPDNMIKAMMIKSAAKTKDGPKVRGGLYLNTPKMALEYEGPRDIASLWSDKNFVDKRPVVVQRNRVMRYRPVFNEWAVTVEFCVDLDVIDISDIKRFLNTGGNLIGIGDYRPQCGGSMGRFMWEDVR
jgi:hypothetical protein